MPDASGTEMSHADRHDLDKLARWKTGLDNASESGEATFPACSIFLVTPEDRASHDIFRRYRDAFEELGGGFHHLVIFGQHGVSATQAAFLAELGMEQRSVPLLAIVPMPAPSKKPETVYCIELPRGDGDGELDDSQSWGVALGAIRAAASGLSLRLPVDVEGVCVGKFRGGSLSSAVAGVLAQLEAESQGI